MKRYDSYRDSGLKWLGEIPSHWEIMPIKRIARTYAGATPNSSNDNNWDGSIPWITPADFKTETKYVEKGDRFLTEQGLNSCSTTLVPAKSVIFSKRAPVGQLSIATQPLCTNQGCISCVPLSVIDSSFLFYLLSIHKETFESLSCGTTFKEISQKSFVDFKISLPPIKEQIMMVNYLDAETSKIDEAIAQQQKIIDLLNERKQIIINNAVTKGLDPNVKMKPSGIDWIGDIPEHWETIRLGFCAWIRARLGWKGLKANEYVDNGYAFLSAFNIQNNLLVWDPLNFINKYRYDESPEIKLKIGDILLVKDGAGIGKCARVDSMPMGEATANGSLAFISPYNSMNYKFLYYFIISNSFRKYTELLINGMGVPHFTQGEMKKVKVPLPPLEEQSKIADILDAEIDKLNQTVNHYQKQITLLQERKQIIINDVVTGKVKVI